MSIHRIRVGDDEYLLLVVSTWKATPTPFFALRNFCSEPLGVGEHEYRTWRALLLAPRRTRHRHY